MNDQSKGKLIHSMKL